MNNLNAAVLKVSALLVGYAEAAIRGGRDERGVRCAVIGEGGYGRYLLGMTSQLLQPFASLTRK